MCLYNFPEVVIFIVYEALASNIEFSLDFIMNKYLFRMVGDEPGFFFFFFASLDYVLATGGHRFRQTQRVFSCWLSLSLS